MKATLRKKRWYIPNYKYPICSDAADWINSQEDLNPQELWEICPQPYWMIWILQHTPNIPDKVYRKIAYEIAATTIKFTLPKNQKFVYDALDVISRYINGKATKEELSIIRNNTFSNAYNNTVDYAAVAIAWAASTDTTIPPSLTYIMNFTTKAITNFGNDNIINDSMKSQANIIRRFVPNIEFKK